jgi:hypothetical protein
MRSNKRLQAAADKYLAEYKGQASHSARYINYLVLNARDMEERHRCGSAQAVLTSSREMRSAVVRLSQMTFSGIVLQRDARTAGLFSRSEIPGHR